MKKQLLMCFLVGLMFLAYSPPSTAITPSDDVGVSLEVSDNVSIDVLEMSFVNIEFESMLIVKHSESPDESELITKDYDKALSSDNEIPIPLLSSIHSKYIKPGSNYSFAFVPSINDPPAWMSCQIERS
jgi:hypothetical protein